MISENNSGRMKPAWAHAFWQEKEIVCWVTKTTGAGKLCLGSFSHQFGCCWISLLVASYQGHKKLLWCLLFCHSLWQKSVVLKVVVIVFICDIEIKQQKELCGHVEIHFQPEGVRVTPVTSKSSLLDVGSLTMLRGFSCLIQVNSVNTVANF